MIPPELVPNFGAESGSTPPLDDTLRAVLGAWRSVFYELDDAPSLAWLGDDEATRLFSDKARALPYAQDPASRAALVFDEDARLPGALPPLPDYATSWTLKPRFSSSGRGRARVDSVDDLRRAWPRLRARGGAVLEPWCARAYDLSASGRVHDTHVELLGACALDVTPAGVPRGVEASLDGDRVRAGTPFDDEVLEAARRVGADLARAGYRGFFGVDAFVYAVGGRPTLRCPVEVNPRWTLGVLGCLHARARAPRGAVAMRLGFGPVKGESYARWGGMSLSFTSGP